MSDPVETLLSFIEEMDAVGKVHDPMKTVNRERWIVTLLVSVLSDPNHRIGREVMRPLIRQWGERGGKYFIRGGISRNMLEPDQFHFSVRYLRDCGLTVRDISRALCVNEYSVIRTLNEFKSDILKDFD